MNDESLSLQQIDRMMLTLFEERMQYVKEHEKEDYKIPTAEDLLNEEEMKSTALLSASTSFLRMLNALSITHSPISSYYSYPSHIRNKMATTPNDFPRISSVGFCRKSAEEAARAIFPAGRIVSFAGTLSLVRALTDGKIDYAVLPMEDKDGYVGNTFSYIRRFRLFVVASYTLKNGGRVVVVSSNLTVFPESDRILLYFQMPKKDNTLPTVTASFFSQKFQLLSLQTYQGRAKDRIAFRAEISVPSLSDDSLFILDVLDSICDDFIFQGIYPHRII